MKALFDETFTTEDRSRASRNLWYGYLEMSADGEYGRDIWLTDSLLETLCETVKRDLSESKMPLPTETNWYFYGDAVTEDAIGDSIRPTLMIREKNGDFLVHINMSDHDFAVNIDAILLFQTVLQKRLGSC